MQRAILFCRRISSNLTNFSTNSNLIPVEHVVRIPSAACLARLKHTDNAATNETPAAATGFTGYIPIELLEFTYSRSSGPGGQNVNKVNTKVEVRFHVPSATWVPAEIKTKLMEQQQNHITKEGYLVITSDRTRKQILNQADCLDKLRSMIFRAAYKPRGLTEEEIQLKNKRLAKAKEQTLREKRMKSLTKQSRGNPSMASV